MPAATRAWPCRTRTLLRIGVRSSAIRAQDRMELDYGDCWASIKILEFRREQGMQSHLGTPNVDDLK